jgi:phosphoribosyl 1,2-cyclic phosphodiesterase
LESNHDADLLKNADRPWSLKQRIGGRQGHLSNEQAAALIRDISGPQLRAIFLAHLSSDCNRPELAVRHAQAALQEAGHAHVAVKLTYQDRVSDVVEVDAPI